MADLLVRIAVYCTCGTRLEDVEAHGAAGLGWFTVKPCRNCSASADWRLKKEEVKHNPNNPYGPDEDNRGPLGSVRRGD